MNNEIIEKEENRECDKKQAINKNAKKSWRDGGIFAVLALLIYSFQVLSEYLVSAAIRALQVIKDDPSSFYRASTDKLEIFLESANITLMVALFVALIINFVYRLSVSETPSERRGVLNGFLLGVGAVITATLAMTIEIVGIVGIFSHMQLLLGAMPAFFMVRFLEKLFVKFSKGKIAKAQEWVRKADTVTLFISLGAVLIVLALLLYACIGGGGGFGFALAFVYIIGSVLFFAAFVAIIAVYLTAWATNKK